MKKVKNWHHKFWLLQGWAQDTKGDWGQLYALAILHLEEKSIDTSRCLEGWVNTAVCVDTEAKNITKHIGNRIPN